MFTANDTYIFEVLITHSVKVQNVQNGLLVYDPMLIPLTTQILPL